MLLNMLLARSHFTAAMILRGQEEISRRKSELYPHPKIKKCILEDRYNPLPSNGLIRNLQIALLHSSMNRFEPFFQMNFFSHAFLIGRLARD